MGLLDSVFNRGGGEEEDEDFADEFEEDEDFVEESIEEEELEEETPEWDSAYHFGEDMLEESGFANMEEFIRSFMMYKVNRSPIYRDRLQNGVETMNMVTQSAQQIRELKGMNKGQKTNFQEELQRVESADQLIDRVDKMSGKEDEMVNQIMTMGQQMLGQIGGKGQRRQGRPVRSSVERTDEEI